MDKEKLEQLFGQFNRAYFGGKLPEPRLEVDNSRTQLGQFRCDRRRKWPPGTTEMANPTIKVSAYYDLPQHEAESILLHEMIHYYIAWSGQCDTAPHGQLFRQWMDRLNGEHGWNIRVSVPTDGLAVAEHNRKKDYLVLALETAVGQRMLSVVNPKYQAAVERLIRRAPSVCSHKWLHTDDVYFARFPAVRSLRGCRVTAEVFDKYTRAAHE